MIFVDKSGEPVPAPLKSTGQTELTKARKLADEKKPVKLKFTAYSNSEVKDALFKLFNRKCAYCESSFDHVGPGAVEHFRPKGIDRRKNKSPRKEFEGYYWLAADWDNLLLSCTDCNSERGHLTGKSKEKVNMGKQDKFPLTDETKRCFHYKDDVTNELPFVLLVNPCTDKDIEKYFEYTVEGEIKVHQGLVSESDKTKSETSIDVYALRRSELVGVRRKYFVSMVHDWILQLENHKQTLAMLPANANAATEHINKQMNKIIRDLIMLGDSKREYSAMMKQLVKKELMDRLGVDVNNFI